ncbi:MAG: ABC transporter substrate-binding protein [Nocardioidaceae bacterium]|nr:ABC transporter substrate-binding protein [Nocardioidaceae bacterium]MDQ3324433.1 ABC transporter substrate-binding protein [Actinomycetota bacterium]
MRLRSHTFRAAAVVAASALVLAACGGSDSESGAGSEESSSAEPSEESDAGGGGGGKGDGTLVVGTLLPQTGDLAFLGPPEFAGVDLAVKEVNEAGGVNGSPVKQVKADSGDGTPNIAPQETNNLLDAGADVVVGAASSSVSLSVIDKITGAGVVHFSPANTSTAFDTYDDKGLYFRTAPSDVLQGAVLANLVASDGFSNVAIMARQDSYGEALANQVEEVFTEQGGTITDKVLYNADAGQFNAEVDQIAANDPEAIVLIAFNETTKIIPALTAKGIGPQDKQIYFVDGNTADYSKDFDKGTLEGVKATYPGAELSGDFRKRMLSVDKSLSDFTYGPESYDAVVVTALAATVAGDDSGEAVAKEINGVTTDGEKCTEYAKCVEMIKAGDDIDYDGVSGPLEFNDTGSPSAATIGIFEYTAANIFENVRYITGQV